MSRDSNKSIAAILAALADTKAALDGTSSTGIFPVAFGQLLTRYLVADDGRPRTRSIQPVVAGDSAAEMEAAAMAAAREFFGPDAELTLHRSYGVTLNGNPHARAGKWSATVLITEDPVAP